MSNKVKIILILVGILTLGLFVSVFFISQKLNVEEPSTPEPIEQECPEAGKCEFKDCNSQYLYSENCQKQEAPGFCCEGYKSPTDRCEKKTFCETGVEEGACKEADTTFNTCGRCSAGSSSEVKVIQGKAGCEYEYSICKADSTCGEAAVSTDGTIQQDKDNCAGDRKVGEEWKECCIGDNIGKSRSVKKNEDCSFTVVLDCADDIECAVSKPTPKPTQAVNVGGTPISTIAQSKVSGTPSPSSTGKPISGTNTPTTSTTNVTPTVKAEAGVTIKPTQVPIAQNITQAPTLKPIASITQSTGPSPTVKSNSTTAPTPTIKPGVTVQPQATVIASNPSVSPGQITPQATTDTVIAEQPPIIGELPETSLPFSQIGYALLGISITLFGVQIYRNKTLRMKFEGFYIEIGYSLFPFLMKYQKNRTRKIYEEKIHNKTKES